MQYTHHSQLAEMRLAGLISARRHQYLPLTIYNYTVKAQFLPVVEWPEALKDCRGLILDDDGQIIARPFRKFWNLEQVSAQLPDGEFNVWEKLDGSLGIVAGYGGEIVVATRGSFDSDQARWFAHWLRNSHPTFCPSGETWLFEIIYPENRIVVDYRGREEAVLLGVMSPDCFDLWGIFDGCARFRKARRFDGLSDFSTINSDPRFAGEEGFVLQWPNGFRAKVKLDEYKRLHRLITQCSTRTIWELLRTGSGIQELLDRVPAEFSKWVSDQSDRLTRDHFGTFHSAKLDYDMIAPLAAASRKDFAMAAKDYRHPNLLFALLDGKDITDACWKIVEPKWATPFKREDAE
ncbi:MAG: RNA ligase [Acidobacteriota bacterium]